MNGLHTSGIASTGTYNVGVSDDELGPIDYLVVEFPGGRLTDEDFAPLLDAVNGHAIRVLDLEFIAKDADGSIREVEPRELDNPEGVDLAIWDGAASGLCDASDIAEVGAAIQPGSIAAIVIYENLWVLSLANALERHGARLVTEGRVSPEEVIAALDQTERRWSAVHPTYLQLED